MLTHHLGNFCQLGYVTRDLDEAMDRFKADGRIREFAVYDANLDVLVGAREDQARIRVALANLGRTQVELIEPVDGAIGIYRDRAPDAHTFLHHVAAQVSGAEQMFDEELHRLERDGYPLAVQGEGGRAWGTLTRFAYLDLRPWVGHFFELIWRSPGAQAAHEWLPDQAEQPL